MTLRVSAGLSAVFFQNTCQFPAFHSPSSSYRSPNTGEPVRVLLISQDGEVI